MHACRVTTAQLSIIDMSSHQLSVRSLIKAASVWTSENIAIFLKYRDISKKSISFSTIRYIDIENDISIYRVITTAYEVHWRQRSMLSTTVKHRHHYWALKATFHVINNCKTPSPLLSTKGNVPLKAMFHFINNCKTSTAIHQLHRYTAKSTQITRKQNDGTCTSEQPERSISTFSSTGRLADIIRAGGFHPLSNPEWSVDILCQTARWQLPH